MSYTVYILHCADGSYYTGITTDMERRLKEHNGEIKGGAKYTRDRKPVTLAYSEECSNRSSATKREYEIKHLNREKKKELINLQIKQLISPL
ncbi:MAG: GIY-YIG nuclease family protein [bacterium]|nr:GIY-YIG nuclease family protein [bacterium]